MLHSGVHKFSKNLGATSIFWVQQWWHAAVCCWRTRRNCSDLWMSPLAGNELIHILYVGKFHPFTGHKGP